MKNRQINLYLTKDDMIFIENYLIKNNFKFCKEKRKTEKTIYDAVLMREEGAGKTILLPGAKVQSEKFGKHWQFNCNYSEMIEFSYFGARENVMRVRFFYSPAILTDEGYTKKSAEFLKKADSFFRWLCRNFVKYPQLPNFYHAKNVELKEAF